MSTLADMGLKVVFVFSMFLVVFALASLVVLVSLVFPMVFDIFKCTLDSSKRLGRGCAPLLNKAFTLHEFPYIRVTAAYIYEGFPLYKLFPCIRDFLV